MRLWVKHFCKLLSPTVKTSGKKVVHAPVLPGVQLVYDTSPFVMSELKAATERSHRELTATMKTGQEETAKLHRDVKNIL